MTHTQRRRPGVHHHYLAESHDFDSKRLSYLADKLDRAGQHQVARLAERWADHHFRVARQLRQQAR